MALSNRWGDMKVWIYNTTIFQNNAATGNLKPNPCRSHGNHEITITAANTNI
uniref:Uncharacterized protein n=1 Tax=Rhizophora mucronata TaxID=61149 RepID=A0A2P2QTE8_RHIMU